MSQSVRAFGEKLERSSATDFVTLVRVQVRNRFDGLPRLLVSHVEWRVGAKADSVGTDKIDQVTQGAGFKDQAVEPESTNKIPG